MEITNYLNSDQYKSESSTEQRIKHLSLHEEKTFNLQEIVIKWTEISFKNDYILN